MPHYVKVSMPKADAVALLALARLARNGLERPLTFEEGRAIESLEYAIEGKDRRKTNRHSPLSRPKPRVELDLRRRA